MIKLSYHVPSGRVINGGSDSTHAVDINNDGGKYDDYVRAIYWEDKRVVYFRFHGPFDNPDEIDHEKSFRACGKALDGFKKARIIPAKVKVLFWQHGYGVTERETRY